MKQQKPSRNHFIPQSYIRNFSWLRMNGKNRKYFVEAKRKQSDKIYEISTVDICVQTDLYTLNFGANDGDSHSLLETHYAKNVDSELKKVYEILLDPTINKIDLNAKRKIIYCLLSLYFRTPKFLNISDRAVDEKFQNALNDRDQDGYISLIYDGRKLIFHERDLDTFKKSIKKTKRAEFILAHLQNWYKFVHMRKHGYIHVFKVLGNSKLISSDNPVSILVRDPTGDIFAPENSIQMPLTPEYLLWISPVDNNWTLESSLSIVRDERDESFTISSNILVEELAETWIFGPKKSILNYSKEKSDLINGDSLYRSLSLNIRNKTNKLERLYNLILNLGIEHRDVFRYYEELCKLSEFNDDRQLIEIGILLRAYHRAD